MIEGGWPFVWTAYAVTFGALVTLTVIVWSRLASWAKEARALDAKRSES